MPSPDNRKLIDVLEQTNQVQVAWLYGSRATNSYSDSSDYDIAVALLPEIADFEQRQTAIDDMQYQLTELVGTPVSVVDVNNIPVPLAQNIVSQGRVLLCLSDFRLRAEEQRIWSLWEEYKREHEHNRKAI
jgi:predicted nucleotidyltransferase